MSWPTHPLPSSQHKKAGFRQQRFAKQSPRLFLLCVLSINLITALWYLRFLAVDPLLYLIGTHLLTTGSPICPGPHVLHQPWDGDPPPTPFLVFWISFLHPHQRSLSSLEEMRGMWRFPQNRMMAVQETKGPRTGPEKFVFNTGLATEQTCHLGEHTSFASL